MRPVVITSAIASRVACSPNNSARKIRRTVRCSTAMPTRPDEEHPAARAHVGAVLDAGAVLDRGGTIFVSRVARATASGSNHSMPAVSRPTQAGRWRARCGARRELEQDFPM